jgi:hypothetical protein
MLIGSTLDLCSRFKLTHFDTVLVLVNFIQLVLIFKLTKMARAKHPNRSTKKHEVPADVSKAAAIGLSAAIAPETTNDVETSSTTPPAVKYTIKQLTKMHVLFAHSGDHKSRSLAEEKQKDFESRGGKISFFYEPTGLPATDNDLARNPAQVKIRITYTKKHKMKRSTSGTPTSARV